LAIADGKSKDWTTVAGVVATHPDRVVPKQADEFTCSTCFLVHHRHRYAGERAGLPICRDCAA